MLRNGRWGWPIDRHRYMGSTRCTTRTLHASAYLCTYFRSGSRIPQGTSAGPEEGLGLSLAPSWRSAGGAARRRPGRWRLRRADH
eukprot:scaffold85145_cov80-Phaeocystis_antarctica.AAC.2